MRRRLTAAAAALLAVLASVVVLEFVTAGSASATCPPDPVDDTGLCLSDTIPGSPGGGTPGGGNTGGGHQGPSGPACPGAPGGQCTNSIGYIWLGSHHCYGFKLNPQPGPTSPLWKGHDPSQGSIWSCDPTVSVPGNTWFVANGKEPAIDPAKIAQQLVAKAPFEVAKPQTAPAPQFTSLVNFVNWAWVPANQWHNVSVSLAAAGAKVTLTAKPSYVHWQMGTAADDARGCQGQAGSVWSGDPSGSGPDGDAAGHPYDGHPFACSSGMDCPDAGRAWATGMPDNAVTDCGWTYTFPSVSYTASFAINPNAPQTWTITAGLFYDVSWTCTGNCSSPNGDLGTYPAPTGTSCLTVYERQTVTVDQNAPQPPKPTSYCR